MSTHSRQRRVRVSGVELLGSCSSRLKRPRGSKLWKELIPLGATQIFRAKSFNGLVSVWFQRCEK